MSYDVILDETGELHFDPNFYSIHAYDKLVRNVGTKEQLANCREGHILNENIKQDQTDSDLINRNKIKVKITPTGRLSFGTVQVFQGYGKNDKGETIPDPDDLITRRDYEININYWRENLNWKITL